MGKNYFKSGGKKNSLEEKMFEALKDEHKNNLDNLKSSLADCTGEKREILKSIKDKEDDLAKKKTQGTRYLLILISALSIMAIALAFITNTKVQSLIIILMIFGTATTIIIFHSYFEWEKVGPVLLIACTLSIALALGVYTPSELLQRAIIKYGSPEKESSSEIVKKDSVDSSEKNTGLGKAMPVLNAESKSKKSE